jgi:hypothetical protein
LAVAIGFAVGAFPSVAMAEHTMRMPEHPHYRVEMEPRGLGGSDSFGYLGFGAGLRPSLANGFAPRIDQLPASTFGLDWRHIRFHFNRYVTLTLRIGYPLLGVGLSFAL